MSIAFEVTLEDVQNEMETSFGENITDEMAEMILDNYIDCDDVVTAALNGNDLDEQTQFACAEIKLQIRNNWDDINTHLNG
jgi:hypothetical protein